MLSGASPRPPRDEPHHHGVIRKLDDGVTVVGWGAVVRVEGVEQRAQQTALWGACTEAEMVHSNLQAATRQEAVDPHAEGVWKSQVSQFVHQFVRGFKWDSNISQLVLYKQSFSC